MSAAANARAHAPLPRRSLLALVAVVGASLVIGWALAFLWASRQPLAVAEQLHGTVALVNGPASKICLDVGPGLSQRCSRVYESRDSTPLEVGSAISVAVVLVPSPDGTGAEEVFIVLAR
jgi:hypothetical protein